MVSLFSLARLISQTTEPVKTQEHENDNLLDGGKLGNERMLYYRELVARFGHVSFAR